MKLAVGIILAIVLHLAVLLFGGAIFGAHKPKPKAPQQVDLVSDEGVTEEKKDKKKEDKPPEEAPPEVTEAKEAAPDAEQAVRALAAAAPNDAPALEAASLSAIEQALGGGGGGGEFGDALSFASGGRIGGTGKAGSAEQKIDDAFSLAEIDQKPRPVFQASPNYPADLRGSKTEGVVTVLFIVDPTGKVMSPKVERSSHPSFEKPALEAVRQWKFEPGLRGGERVACRLRVPIRFQAG